MRGGTWRVKLNDGSEAKISDDNIATYFLTYRDKIMRLRWTRRA